VISTVYRFGVSAVVRATAPRDREIAADGPAREHRGARAVDQVDEQPPLFGAPGSPVLDLEPHVEHAVDERRIERGHDLEVAHVHLGSRDEIHVPLDAAEAPEVLVLQIAPVAPPVHLHRQEIVPGTHVLGDVELGGQPAVLAVADLAAVHPDVHRRLHRAEVQIDSASLPVVWHREVRAVRADRIVLVADEGRVRFERVGLVEIDRDAEAVHLPAPGHRNLGPAAIVVPVQIELGGAVGRLPHPVKLPAAVQRLEIRRRVEVAAQGKRPVLERKGRRVRRLLVDGEHRGVFPLRHVLRGRRPHGEEDRHRNCEAPCTHHHTSRTPAGAAAARRASAQKISSVTTVATATGRRGRTSPSQLAPRTCAHRATTRASSSSRVNRTLTM
jgi:hypothetical protein